MLTGAPPVSRLLAGALDWTAGRPVRGSVGIGPALGSVPLISAGVNAAPMPMPVPTTAPGRPAIWAPVRPPPAAISNASKAPPLPPLLAASAAVIDASAAVISPAPFLALPGNTVSRRVPTPSNVPLTSFALSTTLCTLPATLDMVEDELVPNSRTPSSCSPNVDPIFAMMSVVAITAFPMSSVAPWISPERNASPMPLAHSPAPARITSPMPLMPGTTASLMAGIAALIPGNRPSLMVLPRFPDLMASPIDFTSCVSIWASPIVRTICPPIPTSSIPCFTPAARPSTRTSMSAPPFSSAFTPSARPSTRTFAVSRATLLLFLTESLISSPTASPISPLRTASFVPLVTASPVSLPTFSAAF